MIARTDTGTPGARSVADARGRYRVERAPASAPPLSEAQLFALWKGRRFPAAALTTPTGVPITVIFQGRPGRGPGPDFRGAVIAGPSGVPLRGDVELHVREADFRAHGHDRDPAYASVVLHVVFDAGGAEVTPLPGGRSAPVVALAPWVAQRAGELRRWAEQPLLWREPCHDAVMRMGAERLQRALEDEGDRRMRGRVERMRARIAQAGEDQAIYEGLLEAMGYGGNAPPMRSLANVMPWRALLALSAGDRARMEALLLGAAGLLPSQRAHRGPVHPHVASLERMFARATIRPLAPALWKLWGVRPANMPARRIATAAALLARLGAPRALYRILDAATAGQLVGAFAAPLDPYWHAHADTCAGPARLPPAAVGRSRAIEIAQNVVIPAALASREPALRESAMRLHGTLARPAVYGMTRFLENALASEGVRIPINARRSQGLLALHKDWCTQNGCGRCPLS